MEGYKKVRLKLIFEEKNKQLYIREKIREMHKNVEFKFYYHWLSVLRNDYEVNYHHYYLTPIMIPLANVVYNERLHEFKEELIKILIEEGIRGKKWIRTLNKLNWSTQEKDIKFLGKWILDIKKTSHDKKKNGKELSKGELKLLNELEFIIWLKIKHYI